MPTVILLSSSPPQVFARSPTPVNYSSASQSSNASLNSDSPGRKRFKTFAVSRGSFSPSSGNARKVLAVKHGDVNKSITPLGRKRFAKSKPASQDETETTVVEAATSCEGRTEPVQDPFLQPQQTYRQAETDSHRPEEDKGSLRESSVLQRAVARRIDWTPPKSGIANDTSVCSEQAATFPEGLLGDFSYYDPQAQRRERVLGDAPVVKRRKVSLPVKHGEGKVTEHGIPTLKPNDSLVGKKRSKSPPKKPLTITALATSNYLDQGNSKSSMMQFLAATQIESAGDSQLESKVRQQVAVVKKLKASKKTATRSFLVSPSSALKSFENQEAIFGSASQLVTDKKTTSSTPPRGSDCFTISDPPSSPAQTQPVSVESTTPQLGTARYRRSRNLWAAAGRDEDNALLHVDMVDLTDSPVVRDAFTGKDVMIQPSSSRQVSKQTCPPKSVTPFSIQQTRMVRDIDDIIISTKASPVQRAFSTSAQPCTSTNTKASMGDSAHLDAEIAMPVKPLVQPSAPASKKPNLAGLSDAELRKRVSAFGFKAVRGREKMITLLDKCWSEQHHSEANPAQEAIPTSLYGDILSEVHDVSARPLVKKAKIPRTRKKPDEAGEAIPTKKPKQRRKKEEDGTIAGKVTKPTRKRKTMASEKPAGHVYDIESLDSPGIVGKEDEKAKSPVKRPRAKTARAAKVTKPSLLTPPLTHPDTQTADDILGERSSVLATALTGNPDQSLPIDNTPSENTLTTPKPSLQPDIQDQITRAINHESFTSNVHITSPSKSSSSMLSSTNQKNPSQRRNHQTHPTWHEKILLYDPIILEDLAAWLNTTGLGQIGEDREVSALEVRSWCEERGICCLWKGGWRGNNSTNNAGGGD